jgi:4-amino-4-deoxychorismate lyase
VLKIIITRGSGPRGYHVADAMQSTRIIIANPVPDYPSNYYEQGIRLRICDLRLSLQPRLAGIKHLNRLENVLARQEWNDVSIAEGLLLDMEDCVIGGTMTNLFILKGNELWTPDLTRCGVAGVQRKRVLEQAAASRIPCAERRISLAEVLQADEIFLTNSVIGVWQVKEIGQNHWEKGIFTPKVRKWLNEPCD